MTRAGDTSLAFVGRGAELRLLTEFVRDAGTSAAAHRAMLVSGEPGVGKSRLLAEALRARPTRLAPIRMAGYEPERHVPLAAVQPLLRAVGMNAAATRDQLAAFEAVRAHFARDAAATLLVLDDAQWADSDSLALLHYVLRAAEGGAGLRLLLAHRPDPAMARFATSLQRLLHEDMLTIVLLPLPPDEALLLAERLSPANVAAEVADRSGGSPFWIQLLATAVHEHREPRELVEDRFAALEPDEVELLALLAVVGHPIAAPSAQAVLRWPAARLRASMAGLIAAGLGRDDPSGISVVHDLIREAVIGGLALTNRARLHRAFGHHLESIAQEDLTLLREALVHRLGGREPIGDLVVRITTSPGRRLLGPDGLADLVALVTDRPAEGAGPGGAVEVHTALGELASELGAHELARIEWATVVDLQTDPRQRAHAALSACRAAAGLEDLPAARRFLAQARTILSDEPNATLEVTAEALESSVSRWLEGDVSNARRHADEALSRARAMTGEAQSRSLAPDQRQAYLESLRAAMDAAMQAIERSRMAELAREMAAVAGTDHFSRLEAEYQLGVAQSMIGQPAEAEGTLRAVWEEAERRTFPRLRADAGYFLAIVLLDLGRAAAAIEIARETAALLERVGGHLKFGNRIASALAVAEIVAGDWRRGLQLFEADAARQTDPHARLRTITGHLAWLARLSGTDAGAEVRGLVADAVRDMKDAGCRRCGQEGHVMCAEALAIVGEADAAAAMLAAWQRMRPPEANLPERACASRAAARLDPSPANLRELRDRADEARGTHNILEAVLTLLTAAELATARDRELAVGAAREAGRLAGSSGMTNLEALAQRQARALGLRAWRRSAVVERGDTPRLTPREQQVATRIAAGETNAQIAASLFISPRTVDRHVENILRKLELPNRAAVAASLRVESNG